MNLFAISDTHISRHSSKNQALKHKLEGLREKMYKGPKGCPEDHLLITGDVTDDGAEGQYQEALRLLGPFRGHITLCPGNHDYGKWGNFYQAESARGFWKLAEELGSQKLTYLGGGLVLVCLDSCLRTSSPLDFAKGRIGWWQRKALERRLAGLQDAEVETNELLTIIVALHHHPFDQNWAERLGDRRQFLEAVYGKVDVVFFVHKHEAGQWNCPRGRKTALYALDSFRKGEELIEGQHYRVVRS